MIPDIAQDIRVALFTAILRAEGGSVDVGGGREVGEEGEEGYAGRTCDVATPVVGRVLDVGEDAVGVEGCVNVWKWVLVIRRSWSSGVVRWVVIRSWSSVGRVRRVGGGMAGMKGL